MGLQDNSVNIVCNFVYSITTEEFTLYKHLLIILMIVIIIIIITKKKNKGQTPRNVVLKMINSCSVLE